MVHFSHLPTLRASSEFTIRCNSAGRWVAEETHGSVGGIFVSREVAVRFVLRETDGDAGRVHIKPVPRLQSISG